MLLQMRTSSLTWGPDNPRRNRRSL